MNLCKGIIGIMFLHANLLFQVIAQTKDPNVTAGLLVTERYLPEVIKDDFIKILHLHNIAIVEDTVPQDDHFFETCKETLENMTQVGDSLISQDSGFIPPENNKITDEIFNITADINKVQQEVTQVNDKAEKYARLLNDTVLERHLDVVITGCEVFSKDITQLGFEKSKGPQIVALFASYCIVLEARILGLLQTLSVVIKIRHKGVWRPQYDFKEKESNLTKHWVFLTSNVESQLATFNNSELGKISKLKDLFKLKGIGEGVLLNAVQLNEKKECDCPKMGVHTIYSNNTPSALTKFAEHSTCLGDVYDCKRGANEYLICFSGKQSDFTRYKAMQVESKTDNKIYPNEEDEMPDASECHPSELIEAKSTCSFCQCKCFEARNPSNIINKFSLDEVLSEVTENRVVLRMKFKQIDGTIKLMIEEAPILKYGRIKESKKYVDAKQEDEKFQINATHRSIALTDVIAPPNHVVTGVRFVAYPVQLQIRIHKYNFFTGELEKGNGTWILGNGTPEKPRKKISMEDLERPSESEKSNSYTIFENSELEFQPTSWETDIASHIVPYFDSAIQHEQSLPLMGLGMIYRSKTNKPEEAGVISPRIHKYNFSKLWIPQEIIIKDEKIPETMKSGIGIPMIVGVAAAVVIGIGALLFVATKKQKGQRQSENPKDAPKILDTVNFRANDKSSSDTSSNEDSSDDDSDSSSDEDSVSSIEPLSLSKK